MLSVRYRVPLVIPARVQKKEPAGDHCQSDTMASEPLDESSTKPIGDGSNCTWFGCCHKHCTPFVAEWRWIWALGDFYMLWPSGISGNVRG